MRHDIMPGSVDVLIFAEDPGATNYLAPIPAALAGQGWRCTMLAAGLARELLRQRGVNCEAVDGQTDALALLTGLRPRLLLVGTAENPDTFGLRLIDAAAKARVLSVAVIDAAMKSEQRFRGHGNVPLAHCPDRLIVTDEWTAKVFRDLGYAGECIAVCGNPHHDAVREAGRQLAVEGREAVRRKVMPDAPAKQRVVIFVDEGAARLGTDPVGYLAGATLSGRGGAAGRTELAMEEFLDAARLLARAPWLVLRLHPKDKSEDFSAYLDEFDMVSGCGSAQELVYAADLVVGMTSMLLFEAALLGRPTLAILPHARERDWLPGARVGSTPCVSSREDLRRALLDWALDHATQTGIVQACVSDATGHVVSHIDALLREDQRLFLGNA